MSNPITNSNNPIQAARVEIISAMSSLHMEPEQLDEPLDKANYLAFQDKWAAHACEHLNAALEHLRKLI